ncbi:ABC transporter related protein [Conexibacter woesei DSM 14684]|uniref:ABC transporter related protein n=1 Tax=Conexibacter woesei (strain DSM 14684 / CCUG 47730 / CIP 108061 / JCM 11494 / NBRC 100937 / ID131577) TaxID=469383 RepID=D3F793_CONWI|nr:ABC transporter related protein [Conexibacter woesei DSM 14684]
MVSEEHRREAAMLDVGGLTVEFGGVRALDGVRFAVPARQVCGLIGPNGAGKTTLFNCVSRFVDPTGGTLSVAGSDLLARRAHEVAALGVARTFQNLGLLDALSVRENVKLGSPAQRDGTPWRALRGGLAREDALDARADDVLALLGLADAAERRPGELPFGTLKRVELARALMGEPHLLLLDEPANGLSHGEVDELAQLLLGVRERLDLTLVLVEHHMGMIRAVADRAVVLDFGRVIADGEPERVCVDPVVVEAYLGTAAAA